MGAILDLPSPAWFGEFSAHLTVHVIDSTRPQNLSSLFGGGDIGDRIVLWDDGEVDTMDAQRKAWEALEVRLRSSQKPLRLTDFASTSRSRTQRMMAQTSTRSMKRKTMQAYMRTPLQAAHHASVNRRLPINIEGKG